jgi:integrase
MPIRVRRIDPAEGDHGGGLLLSGRPDARRQRRSPALELLSTETQRTEVVVSGVAGFVFTSTIGTPHDGSGVSRRFHAALEAAGLPRQRFHDLRHACASLLLVQGVAPRVVMEILGHSQISLTMNTYSHVIPELQRDAAARMDEALR